jgi:hopanoid biosynthesis associated RND transporter like protein HpnN
MSPRRLPPARPRWTGRLLRRVVALSCARPLLTIGLAVGLAVMALGYSAHALKLETSKFHLLPLHKPYAALYKNLAEDFGQLQDIVVVVEGPTVETATAYAARLVQALRAGRGPDDPVGRARISYRADTSRLEPHALLYVPVERLRQTLDTIASQEDLLAEFAADPTLDRLVDGINQYLGATALPSALGPESAPPPPEAPVRLVEDFLTRMAARIDGQPYRSPWSGLLAAPTLGADGGYFLSPDRRLLYVVVDLGEAARTFEVEDAAIVAVRAAIAGLRREFPAVEAGLMGAPVLFNDELKTAMRDGEIASVLALLLTLGLLLLAFRRVLASCAMLAVLALSLAWSLGAVTLLVGHLTIFSMMFVSVVVGIGIDYGIFTLFRYREERVLGRSALAALEATAARSGPAILVSAAATAATFFILVSAELGAIRDFGVVSGVAILLSFVAMLTVFPATLVLLERHRGRLRWRGAGALRAPGPVRALAATARRVEATALAAVGGHAWLIVMVAAIVSVGAAWVAPRVGLDYDILNLQAKGTESVVWERKVAAASGRSVFAALSMAPTMGELKAREAAFRALPSVADVQSVLSVLPDRTEDKLALLRRLDDIAHSVTPGAPRALDLPALTAALETLERRMQLARMAGGGAPPELDAVARATSGVLERIRTRGRGSTEVALADYQTRLAEDFARRWWQFRRATRPAPVALADLPDELRRQYVGKSGQLLLQVYSSLDLADRANQARFVGQLRTVDPDVTGQPVVAYEALQLIENVFRTGLAYALALVIGLAALMIRRLRETVLALVPLILGTLWTVAFMQVTGLRFNLVNVWALPLIVGGAAESGVNIVLRALDARREDGGYRIPRSTALAVLLNGLTTIVGFGSLLVAHHRGVWSFGLLLVIGAAVTLVASLVVLPALMAVVTARPPASLAEEELPAAPEALPKAS